MKKLLGIGLIIILGLISAFWQQIDLNLGALPKPTALFTDSLASSISSSATSFTLVRGTDKEGVALSGTYGFVIDEGSASEELVIATCTSTAFSSVTRGVSVTTATSTVSALRFTHRRGASVKITDFPVLGQIYHLLTGGQRFDYQIGLAQAFVSATASTTDFATKDYVDTVGAGGFTAANIANNMGLQAQATSPETVGVYISATGSALRFGGISDDQLMLKLATSLKISGQGYLGVATSTAFSFTTVTTTSLVIGTTNPVGNFGSGNLYVGGNATSTGSFDVSQICFSGANCGTSLVRVASSSAGVISQSSAGGTLKTYTINAGEAVSGNVYDIEFGFRRTGTAADSVYNVTFNGVNMFGTGTCNLDNIDGVSGNARVRLIFRTGNTMSITGTCIGNIPGTASEW